MEFIRVYDMARGCQYVDEKWHCCARRASSVTYIKFYPGVCGSEDYRSFRCVVHEGWISPDNHDGAVNKRLVVGKENTLGYAP